MKRLLFFVRLLLSGGLLAFLFYQVDLHEIRPLLNRLDGRLVALAIGIGLVDRVLMAYKWNLLLRAQKIWISLVDVTKTYLTATFLGLFLPATVGGDALRTFTVARKGYATSAVLSSILVERVLGLIALVTLAMSSIALSVLVFGSRFFDSVLPLLGAASIFLLVAIVVVVGSLSSLFDRFVAWFLHRVEGQGRGNRVIRLVRDSYAAYGSYRQNKGVLTRFYLLSLAENLFPILWTYLLSLAFQIDVPLLFYFILVPIVLMLRRLPISIDGIGIHETAFVYFLSLIQVDPAEGLLLGIATHILTVLLVLPGGLFFALNGFSAIPESAAKNESEKVSGNPRVKLLGP